MRCTVLVSPAIATRVAPVRVLERLRDALIATEQDPEMAVMRAVVLRGEQLPARDRRNLRTWFDDTRRFVARARVGIGGTTSSGDMLALAVDDMMVIVQIGYVPGMPPIPRAQPRVFLTDIDGHTVRDGLVVQR